MDCFIDVPEDIAKYVKSKNAEEAIQELKMENIRKRKLTNMSKEAQGKLINMMDNHPKGPEVGLRSILTSDAYAIANNSNIEYRQKALQGIAESYIPELKERLSTTRLGFNRDKELGRDFIRAIFGDTEVNPVATRLAKEWQGASDFIRERYNKFGGNVGKLDYGYIPQSHDRVAVQKVPKEDWVNFITPLLKNADEVDLKYVYDTISTGGLNKIKEGSIGSGKSIANKNADPRILHFKNSDDWIAYQEKFGNADPMATIDDHIRSLTTDMSMMEILGPNPNHMFETLKTKVDKDMVGKKGKEWRSYTDSLYAVVSGKVDSDLSGIGLLGPTAQTLRAVNTATMLGSATLSAVSDTASLFVNSTFQGMNPFKVMLKMGKMMKIKNQEDAIRAGLGADVFNSEITRRFSEVGEGFWSKASEALMRATFMDIWTEAGRKAFQTEYMHKVLDGRKIADLSVDEQIKVLEKVQTETDFAVLMPTARTRAITTAGKEKGTAMGEFVRTSTQFSSFPLVFMQQHGARMFMQNGAGSRIAYGASLITLTTLVASFAMMSKDFAKGFTPREGMDITDESIDTESKVKFWSAAALQGGGLGVFGDLIFSDQTRYGNSPLPTMAGPTGSVIEDAVKLTVGNAQQAIKGETTHAGSEAVDFINRHANPVNTFYTKLLIEQYVARNLKILLDDDYERSEARKLRKRNKEYGQEKWLENN